MISVANCPPAKGESEQLVHRHVRPFGIWQLAESLKGLVNAGRLVSLHTCPISCCNINRVEHGLMPRVPRSILRRKGDRDEERIICTIYRKVKRSCAHQVAQDSGYFRTCQVICSLSLVLQNVNIRNMVRIIAGAEKSSLGWLTDVYSGYYFLLPSASP